MNTDPTNLENSGSGAASNAEASHTVQEVFDSLNEEQKLLLEYLIGEAVAMGNGLPIDDFEFAGDGEDDDDYEDDESEYEDDEEDDEDDNDDALAQAFYAELRAELLDLINELAVVRGKVTLSSGQEADYYIDLRRVTLHHRAAPLIGELMLAHLVEHGYFPDVAGIAKEVDPEDGSIGFSAIGGLTLGADPIATAVLHTTSQYDVPVDAFVVRKAAKAHGMQRQIEGPDVTGRNVVIVEDTTTTGGSPITAIEAVRAAGGNPVAVATIVDRNTGAKEKIEALGVPYLPLFTLEDLDI